MKPEGTVYNAQGRINRLSVLCITAYETAVKNGFEGTEEEWLASLKGDKGDKGNTGDEGGYYVPTITQPDANTVSVAFAASKSGMKQVPNAAIRLPNAETGTGIAESITGNPITAILGETRIESVAVQGLTTQAGTGDPSPENIREISGVGVMDGKAEIVPATASAVSSAGAVGTYGYYCFFNLKGVTNGAIVANRAIAENTTFDYSYANKSTSTNVAVSNGGAKYTPRMYFPHEVLGTTTANTDAECKAAVVTLLNKWKDEGNPLTIWYQKATHTEGDPYYTGVSIEDADGYHGYALPLAQPLYTGDTVETNVESEYDKCVVLDGSEDEVYQAGSTATSGKYRFYAVDIADATPTPDTATKCEVITSYLSAVTSGEMWDNKTGIAIDVNGKVWLYIEGVTTAADLRTYLAAHPLTVFYKSTTNGAPLRIAKETHAKKRLVLDGTETWAAGGYGCTCSVIASDIAKPASNSVTTSAKCSHFVASAMTTNPDNGFAVSATSGAICIKYGTNYANSADELTAYLAAQYAAGTPVTIVYALATPEVYAHEPVEIGNEAGSVTLTAENTATASLWANASKGDIAALLKRIEALENA